MAQHDEIETSAIILERIGAVPIMDNVTVLAPGAGEVRVRMAASGVCHTDLAYIRDARECPVVLGHEGAGIVDAAGPGVAGLQPGDHVVLNWLPKCGACRWCLSGHREFCENPLSTQSPRVYWRGRPIQVMLHAGAFCRFAVVPAGGAIRIRPDLPLTHASLLGCAVATGIGAVFYSAKVSAGEGVVVLGVGGVGLHVVQGARLALAEPIIAIDIDASRLAAAKELGATHTVLSTETDPVAAVKEITGGRGVEHVFEVVGMPELMTAGLEMLARAGVLTLVGAAARAASLNFHPRRFMSLQQTIRGCIYGNIRPQFDLPLFADWCVEGKLSLEAMRQQAISLNQVPELFADTVQRAGGRKVIDFSGEQ